jgi:ABC-type spermidine/putrescine transport system permease subunit I
VAADGAVAIDRRRAARRRVLREKAQGLLMVLPPVGVVTVFIGLPVVAAIAYTLGRADGPNSVVNQFAQRQHVVKSGVTLAAYRDVLGNPHIRTDLWATIWVTLVTIAVVLVVSWAIALYLRLNDTWLARTMSALAVVPLFIPVVIASYAILVFYASDGFVKTAAFRLGFHGFPTLGYTLTCVAIGEIWVNVPFGVLMMSSGLNSVPNALIEAARDSGASMTRTVISVLMPLNVIPTVIVGTFTGIYVLGSFTVPYLTGPSAPNLFGPSMSNFFGAFGQPQQAEVMAMIVFILAIGIGTIYVWANVRGTKRASATS